VSLLTDEETVSGSAGSALGNLSAKHLVHTAVEGAGGAAAGTVGVSALFSYAGVGIATVASIIINQSAYQRKIASLRTMYADEISAQTGKPKDKLKDKDLFALAKGDPERNIPANKTLAEELHKVSRRRNVGMLVTASAILGTLAIVMSLPAFGVAAGGAAAAEAGMGAVGAFAVRAFMGFSIHRLLEIPIKNIAKKVFNLNDTTTHDRIAEISKEHRKGKVLGREQVLAVFISANKELGDFVVDHYGKEYDKLSVQEKKVVADAMEQYVPSKHITENLNSGIIKVSELAFMVEGKHSGVAPSSVKQSLSLVGKARTALRGVGERMHKIKQQEVAYAEASPKPQRYMMEYDNPVPARSFVDRLEGEKSRSSERTLH